MAASNARAVEAEAINVELIGTLEAAVSEVTKLENQLQSQTSMFTEEKQRLQEQLNAKDKELADAVGLMEAISKSEVVGILVEYAPREILEEENQLKA